MLIMPKKKKEGKKKRELNRLLLDITLVVKGKILTDQEFLNFGTFSSFIMSDIEDLEGTAQPLQMQAKRWFVIFFSRKNYKMMT